MCVLVSVITEVFILFFLLFYITVVCVIVTELVVDISVAFVSRLSVAVMCVSILLEQLVCLLI